MSKPETTARIVANATAEMNPARTLPPTARQMDGSQVVSAKQRARGVGVGGIAAQQCNAAISDDEQHREEQADEARRVEYRYPRGSFVTDRKEPHQDMRQSRSAKQDSDAERRVATASWAKPRIFTMLLPFG